MYEVRHKTGQYASGKLLGFSVRMHRKSFGGRAPPGHAGESLQRCPEPLAGFIWESVNQLEIFYSGLSGATTARTTSWMMSVDDARI